MILPTAAMAIGMLVASPTPAHAYPSAPCHGGFEGQQRWEDGYLWTCVYAGNGGWVWT